MVPHRNAYDVIIVGGAIIGSTVAYFLTANEQFHGQVLVIEKDPAYQRCSTTLNVAQLTTQLKDKGGSIVASTVIKPLSVVDGLLGRELGHIERFDLSPVQDFANQVSQ